MRTITHRLLGTIGTWLMLSLATAGERKVEYGLAAGQNMPFHVVDFASGPKTGSGCPSIMIGNDKTRGVILWTRTPDAKALGFARSLQEVLGKSPKTQGYLVVFNKPANLAELAKKHGLELFRVGSIRNQSQEEMQKRGALAEADLSVFLLDRKTIKATWSLKNRDLDKRTSHKIIAAAETFLLAQDEEQKRAK